MKYLDISDVKKSLHELLDEIGDSHEKIMITRDGVAVAMLLPFKETKTRTTEPHPLHGKQFWIADDFDEPMEIVWGANDE